jgi:hypothetical protein
MADTVNVADFSHLEHDALGVETMRLTETLIDKVPTISGRIAVLCTKERDGQTSLALISHGQGALEVIREDGNPIEIEYYDPESNGRSAQVLRSPVESLLFTPVVALSTQYKVREERFVTHWCGLQYFATLVAGRALKKQKTAGVVADLSGRPAFNS